MACSRALPSQPRSRIPHLLVAGLLVGAALLAVLVSAASAEVATLDPLARRALAAARTGATVSELRARGIALGEERALDVFIEGSMSRAALEAAGARVRTIAPGIVTAYVPAGAFEAVASLAGVRRIAGAAPVEPELDLSIPTIGAHLLRGPGPGFDGMSGQGVVLGFVDSGIDFDHGDFLDAAGHTRVAWLWDQTRNDAPPPAGYAYGSQWSRADMDGGLCTQAATDGHGTHVAGIAAGDGSRTGGGVAPYTYAGMAPRAELVVVKSTLTTTSILDGVAYVFERAQAMGKPAVVTLSVGTHFGPHDGTSAMEAGLSALTGPGRLIVKSAGNSRGVALHAEVTAGLGDTTISVAINGSTAGRLVQFIGVYESTETLSLRVGRSPGGPIALPVARGDTLRVVSGTASVYVDNGYTLTAGGDPQVYVEITGTTGSFDGVWTFAFLPTVVGPAQGEVDLWRAGGSPGLSANFLLGNQPYQEMITEPGNALDLITVGAWTTRRSWTDCSGHTGVTFSVPVDPGNLSPFSSPGPTRDGRHKPEITAPGSAIASAATQDAFVFCPTTNSTRLADSLSHIVMEGTSMAAPHAAGAIALLLQRDPTLTAAAARSYLAAHATVDAYTGAVWNETWGAGKLHLDDIAPPTVTVTAPNGGETWTVDQWVTLTWNASDALSGVASVDLEWSRTGPGGPFETLAIGVPNTGAHAWRVTGPATVDGALRVTAHDTNGNHGSDTSNAPIAVLTAWRPDGTPLAEAAGAQRHVGLVSDGAGGAFAVWDDDRNTDTDLYATRLTAAATIAQGWPADGIPVAAVGGAQQRAHAVPDGAGGFIAAWEDARGGTPSIYAARVTASGTRAPGWPAGGVAVCVAPGVPDDVAIAADGAGGAFVAWSDARGGAPDVYATRLTASGTVAPGWTPGGDAICTASGNQTRPVVIGDGAGGAVLAWEDRRAGNADLYALRVDGAGDPVSGWTAGGIAVCTAGGSQLVPAIAGDGAGGVIVGWQDHRAGNADVYAAHVTGAGAVPWTANGVPVTVATGGQTAPIVVADGGGGGYVTWQHVSGAAVDVRALRLLASGDAAPGWTTGGNAVCAAAGDQVLPAAVSDGHGGLLVTWEDARTGERDVYAQRLGPTGTPVAGWPGDGLALTGAGGDQIEPAIVADGAGGAIVAWPDLRDPGDTDLYASHVGATGGVRTTLDVPDASGASALALSPARPNPARGAASVTLALARPARVHAEVVDVAGHRVRVVASGAELAAGSHPLVWDGRTDQGGAAPVGMYWIRVRAIGAVVARPVVVLR